LLCFISSILVLQISTVFFCFQHVFQMVGGVVHVYADKHCKDSIWSIPLAYPDDFSFLGFICSPLFASDTERIYPVADATTFFTELHYMLRVIAAGNTRTVCHNRLNLLEHVIILSNPLLLS
jgi:AMP deaminase